jgi:hypothetical protein
MHVIINLVDKYIGLSRLWKSRRGRENIKRGFRDTRGDIGDYIALKIFQ